MSQGDEFNGSRYLVIDNFLDADRFRAARAEFDEVTLRPGLSDIEPILDGMSFRGRSSTMSLGDDADRVTSPLRRAILDQVGRSFGLVDDSSESAARLSINAWGYPPGSRLSWHNDGGKGRLGAFVYFVHERWSAGWGGELAVVDCEASSPGTADLFSEHASELSPVMLWPRPNRLILLKSYTMHSILRVDATAGDRLRKSFSGFVSSGDAAM